MSELTTATQLQLAMNGKDFISSLCSSGYGTLFVLILIFIVIALILDLL